MVLGKPITPVRRTIWMKVGQWPIAFAVGAGWGGLDIFILLNFFSYLSSSLGDRPIYWLVGCLGFNGPFRQYFNLYRAVSKEREKEKRKDRRE